MNGMPSRKKGFTAMSKGIKMPAMKAAKRTRGVPSAQGTEPQDNQMDDMARMMAASGGLQ